MLSSAANGWIPSSVPPDPFAEGGLFIRVEVWLVNRGAIAEGDDYPGHRSWGHYSPDFGWYHDGRSYEAVAWWRPQSPEPPSNIPTGWKPHEALDWRPSRAAAE